MRTLNVMNNNQPISLLHNARLPAWTLPSSWPQHAGGPVNADIHIADGRIQTVHPARVRQADGWDLNGALVLPGLIEPHAHLDKTFTFSRSRPSRPGLLAAIETLQQDRRYGTAQDLHPRAARAVSWAAANGVNHLRTHIDWYDAAVPPAWQALANMSHPDCTFERVALVPLGLFASPKSAEDIARRVAQSGSCCLLGAFVHSSNWDEAAMTNLLSCAARWRLDLDLHIDEELTSGAIGLRWLANYLSTHAFPGHICCSHGCALSASPYSLAQDILSVLAAHRVTLIALPMTNLLLQDAVAGRTPRARGITLIKEAQSAGIPVLLGCDNVQDAFCPMGSYDPLDTLTCALFTAQLDSPFDRQSRLICDRHALSGSSRAGSPLSAGEEANLVIFPGSDSHTWPLRSATRQVIRAGKFISQRIWSEEVRSDA